MLYKLFGTVLLSSSVVCPCEVLLYNLVPGKNSVEYNKLPKQTSLGTYLQVFSKWKVDLSGWKFSYPLIIQQTLRNKFRG